MIEAWIQLRHRCHTGAGAGHVDGEQGPGGGVVWTLLGLPLTFCPHCADKLPRGPFYVHIRGEEGSPAVNVNNLELVDKP